ncbi:pentapeptide repeat-containing protein [Halococcus saccharolyticus]|uniref:pentapeptide repeat-containing protein n=1 Tax=Halococcus saccharolyticus TaxID=62319 RepID=UPI0009B5A768|nr:pentapeptide repeat-containing protein [Halococcus saccharolyticus]
MGKNKQCTFNTEVRERWGDIEDETWRCPHPSHQQNELCIFHLPPKNKSEQLVAERLVKLVNSDTNSADYYQNNRRKKQFIESKFGTLDLTYTTLSPQDNYPIDFRGSEFGSIDMSNSSVMNEMNFCDTVVNGQTMIWPGDFKGETIFARATFHGQVALVGSTFEDELWFTDATFYGNNNLLSGLNASNARVAWFGRTSFFGPIEFENSDFSTITFGGAQFREPVSFDQCSFDSASFNGAYFYDDVSFDEIESNNGLDFTEPLENEPVNSFMETYREDDDPPGTIFEHVCTLENAYIGGELNISSADFRKGASFDGLEIEGAVSIEDANISSEFSIDSASIEGEAELGGNQYPQQASMKCSDIHHLSIQAVGENQEYVTEFDLSQSAVSAGTLNCSNLVFDLEKSTVGDVKLEPHGTEDLLSHYRFLKTSFEGFDFAAYKRKLSEANWDIVSVSSFSEQQIPHSEYEETFLKAKNAAYQAGDIESGSEFHYREIYHRGSVYWENKEGISDLFNFISNRLYLLTCGYGERPYRVLILFALVVGTVLSISEIPLSSIVYVLPFFSALFVFTLTRTLGG